MFTNWPALTVAAISGARTPITNMPRATSRRAVTAASSRNTRRLAPLAYRSHLHLLARVDGGLEEGARRVERCQARDAALDGGAADVEAVLEHGVSVSRVFVDVRHRVDHELHLTADDHVHDGRPLLTDLRDDPGRESRGAKGTRGAVRGDELAPELYEPRDDWEELRLVGVGDRQQRRAPAFDVHPRSRERLAQRLVQSPGDADRLSGRFHLRPEV